jgi:hypothetical protein
MRAAALYGFLWGVMFTLLDELNSSVVWALFWTVEAVQLTIYATLTWQRTNA